MSQRHLVFHTLLAAIVGGVLAVAAVAWASQFPLTKPPSAQQSNLWARCVDPSSPLSGDTIEVVADGQGHLYADAVLSLPDGGLPVFFPDGGLSVQGLGTAGVPTGGVLSVQGVLDGYPQDVTGPGGVPLAEENTQVANNALLATIVTETTITATNTGAPLAIQGGAVAGDFLSLGGQDYAGHSFELRVNDAGIALTQQPITASVPSAALAAYQVICGAACTFVSAACDVDPSLPTAVYYLLLIDSPTLPADGAVSLLAGIRIDHTSGGAADQVSVAAPLGGTACTTGCTLALSLTRPSLTHIVSSALYCNGSVTSARSL
jgi:hypothetical protein